MKLGLEPKTPDYEPGELPFTPFHQYYRLKRESNSYHKICSFAHYHYAIKSYFY